MPSVLLIHGYPQEIKNDHPVYMFFEERGYKLFVPAMFSSRLDFNLENVKKIIHETLGENKPDVILGFSLGGLVLPHIALEYPKAKLIFVSTGLRFSPKCRFYRFMLNLMRTPFRHFAFFILKNTPYPVYSRLYSRFNPCGKDDDLAWYTKDKRYNYDAITSMHQEKARQIYDLLGDINNEDLIKNIKNNSIILAGDNDVLMPLAGSLRLHELIKKSKLVLVKKSHFGVIEKSSLERIIGLL